MTEPNSPVEKAGIEDSADSITCVCGSTTSDEGFGNCTKDGKFVNITIGKTPEGLVEAPEEEQYWVCYRCGRLYNTVALEQHLDATVSGRIDLADPVIDASRQAYWDHITGEHLAPEDFTR